MNKQHFTYCDEEVCLVFAFNNGCSRTVYPLGPLYIGRIIKESNFKLRYLDYQTCKTPNPLDPHELYKFVISNTVSRYKAFPKIVAFSTLLDFLPTVIATSEMLKKTFPDCFIILGGAGPSANPSYIVEHFGSVDAVVYGEGELSMSSLLNLFKKEGVSKKLLSHVPGIAYNWKQKTITNPHPGRIHQLEKISFPLRELMPGSKRHSILTSRGCPYNCAFCDAKTIWHGYHVTRPMKDILQEIDSIYTSPSMANSTILDIVDDAFNIDRDRAITFSQEMKKRNIHWTCYARIDHVDKGLLKAMKRGGCKKIFFGINTGSSKIMSKLNQKLNLKQALGNISMCGDIFSPENISISFMWGFPEETMSDFHATLKLLINLINGGFDWRLFCLKLYPGTLYHKKYHSVVKPLHKLITPANSIAFRFARLEECRCYSELNMQMPWLKKMIMQHPKLFINYYYIPSPKIEEKAVIVTKFFKEFWRQLKLTPVFFGKRSPLD